MHTNATAIDSPVLKSNTVSPTAIFLKGSGDETQHDNSVGRSHPVLGDMDAGARRRARPARKDDSRLRGVPIVGRKGSHSEPRLADPGPGGRSARGDRLPAAGLRADRWRPVGSGGAGRDRPSGRQGQDVRRRQPPGAGRRQAIFHLVLARPRRPRDRQVPQIASAAGREHRAGQRTARVRHAAGQNRSDDRHGPLLARDPAGDGAGGRGVDPRVAGRRTGAAAIPVGDHASHPRV